jgi:hypothetical protein
MKYLYKYTPWIIVAVYLLFFLALRSPERSWDRIINSDGKGYYAYLPAIFIYHDLQFNFVEQYEYQYYPLNRSVFKEFRQPAGDRVVNKYFPGLAILWLPFFFFGHLMAWLEIFPRDGYSLPYQYAILLSAFWFLYLGAKWLMKLLKSFGAGDREASLLTLLITLGTNLLFYVVIEPSMTHVYSFALINGFMLAVHRLFHQFDGKWLFRAVLAFTLIFLIRPTNGMILMTIPFLAGNTETMKRALSNIAGAKIPLIKAVLISLVLFGIPLIIWYIQTGKPLVYTYGEERLNFLQPHILSILFSYNRGWFVFTPIALVALAGFPGLFRYDRVRFFWLLSFLLLFIYVSSSWWVWNYASKFGNRVFIDIYALIAILLLFLYNSIHRNWLKKAMIAVFIILSGLNIFQFWQQSKWIFPPYTLTSEIYWDSFFTLSQKARVYIPESAIEKEQSYINDLETIDPGPFWMNQKTRNDTVFHEGKFSSKADRRIPYSIGFEAMTDTLFTTANRIVRVEAMALSPREVTEATLVIDFQYNEKSLSYNQFLLEKYLKPDRWTPVQMACYLPKALPEGSKVKIYFFNPSSLYKLYIDNLKVDFLSLRSDPEFIKIEGVTMPAMIK